MVTLTVGKFLSDVNGRVGYWYGPEVPRDAERTKRLLLEAATDEFAEHGLDGTTVERIAARAGVNKERLYNYFGDKSTLFSKVLATELGRIDDDVPLLIRSLDDVADFAARSYDYVAEHRRLSRLVIWEGLADSGDLPEEAVRSELYRGKVATVVNAQRAGIITDSIAAADLLFLVLSLSSWWASAPQIARMISSAEDVADVRVGRRASVAEAARRLAAPHRTAL